jgi:hypothetical protein
MAELCPRLSTRRRDRRQPLLPEPTDRDPQPSELISEWEIPVARDLAAHIQPWEIGRASYFPTRWESVPDSATQAFIDLIDVSRPQDMLVAPAGVRRVGGTDVYSPTQVFGLGARGVGLWVDDLPFDRVAGLFGYRDIRMVEHADDGEYARLTVIGAMRRFTMRYRPRSRWPGTRDSFVDDMLIRMRLRAAGLTDSTVEYAGAEGDLETDSPLIGLGVSPVVRSLCAGGAAQNRWRLLADREPRRVVALTEHELVVLRASAGHETRHGFVLAVSRAYLTGLSVAGPRLCVHAGAVHAVTVGHGFARHVVAELAGLVDQAHCPSLPIEMQEEAQ